MSSLKWEHPSFYVNFPSYFQLWSLNQDITFPNLSIDPKFVFWNVGLGLCILPSFPQFIKEVENWNFRKASDALPNFFQFTKIFENWDFWTPLAFIFYQTMRIVLQYDMWRKRGRANFWLNYQFSSKNVYAIM